MGEEIKILDRCERLFLRYGIKSVTMDDVSRELAISKKTLYQYFENKDALVKKVTEHHFDNENKFVDGVLTQSKTAIDQMFAIAQWMHKLSKDMNVSLVFDLKKYHPDAWQVFIHHRNTTVFNCIKENVERGIREGLYREELNPDFIARMYIARVEMFIDPEVFPPDLYATEKIFPVFLDYHLHALATPKGIKYLEKLKTQNNG